MEVNQEMITLAKQLQDAAEADKIDKLLAGAVVLMRNRILIVSRSSADEFLPGYLEIPGGGVDANETILEGLEREVLEETNLEIEKIVLYIGSFNAVSPNGQRVRQFNFLVEPTTDDVRLSEEHADHLWWDIQRDDIDSMIMLDSMKEIVVRAVESIKGSTHLHE